MFRCVCIFWPVNSNSEYSSVSCLQIAWSFNSKLQSQLRFDQFFSIAHLDLIHTCYWFSVSPYHKPWADQVSKSKFLLPNLDLTLGDLNRNSDLLLELSINKLNKLNNLPSRLRGLRGRGQGHPQPVLDAARKTGREKILPRNIF